MRLTMGLDTDIPKCLNGYMNVTTVLARLGLGKLRFTRSKKLRKSPAEAEQELYAREVKKQLITLKEKGLSIPIFTL